MSACAFPSLHKSIKVHVVAHCEPSVSSRRVLFPVSIMLIRPHWSPASLQIKSHRETFCEHAAPADPHHPAAARLPSSSSPLKISPSPQSVSCILVSHLLSSVSLPVQAAWSYLKKNKFQHQLSLENCQSTKYILFFCEKWNVMIMRLFFTHLRGKLHGCQTKGNANDKQGYVRLFDAPTCTTHGQIGLAASHLCK